MKYLDSLIERKPQMGNIKKEIEEVFNVLFSCYKEGNKVLVCGNGGSSADSAHIVGELMKGFVKKRTISKSFQDNLQIVINETCKKSNCTNQENKFNEMINNLEQGLPTIDITSQVALNTAYINDKNLDYVYANSVLGLGKEGDVLIAITTSGNSKNIINASLVAKAKNMKVVALTGMDGGKIKNIADISIIVPYDDTYLIQEEHISIYHTLCLMLEEAFFNCGDEKFLEAKCYE